MSNVNVVIIDDDAWMTERYIHTLQKAGFATAQASNAIDGIELIDSLRPQVVILDMFMPGPNGIVLLHELASHEDLSLIPLIVSTNSANDIPEQELKRYGVSELLDKSSMHPDDIVRAVRRVV